MNTTKKIITWIVVTILAIPAILIFNDNEETIYYNFIGLAYAWLMVKISPLFLPTWMIDYLTDFSEDEGAEL